ncbi:aminopeptidase P family protein [Iningainema tapete]|uniref:Aminopeptidase P family protein n=1 Tax=Iningainema tapete BLCC-T55 TaxID=2748662 RepID=A0A8J6XUI6_9CYAN|nr:aminopeptidase P family protein [Iningainema tapete]MBD2776272.1 aminopeptidase P family protein [Iningainema tapete BLCC-T55]
MTPLDLSTAPTSVSSLQAKLSNLRALMEDYNLDAYLIPSADEHLNEYLPEARQRRMWVSGFTGSAGDLLVGRDWAWLFVDSRYHEQVELEVDLSLVQISKLGLEKHKTLVETLESLGQEATHFRLGFDPFTIQVEQFRTFEKQLKSASVELVSVKTNLVDVVRSQSPWVESEPIPALGNSKVFGLPDEVTGETTAQKLAKVREAMQSSKTDILPITKLDQVAWLFNLRGWDVPYNPVFIAYSLITQERTFLFTNLERIEAGAREALQSYVTLLPYEQYAETLIAQAHQKRVLLDPKHTTMGTYQLLDNARIVETSNPIEGMKARKNAVEVEQMKAANLKASRAKVRTLKWISDMLASGKRLSEFDVAGAIAQFYQQEADFQGLSFNTIAGSGTNSSIVHYGTPSRDQFLTPGQFFLLDSGAQYLGGTTDATRTIIVGEPTSEQVLRYTAVLKAHINCAMQRFPKGATGIQIDGIARSAMWMEELDYGHGTGHGVGAFLNVHEGPNGISKRAAEPLEPGMVTSIEPGFYASGWGGIRIENLYVVKNLTPDTQGETDQTKTPWYGFEPLIYIPFDKRLIALEQIDQKQRQWLENYYAAIVEKLAPTLETSEAEWLREACSL